MSGNASERCDVGASLNKSSLFLQTLAARVAACSWRRACGNVRARATSASSGRRGLWNAVIARSSSKGGRAVALRRCLMR